MITGERGQSSDSGTGRDIADWLARTEPVWPVVIHSTNTAAAEGMQFVLEDAGWNVRRIAPYGDLEWINDIWLRTIRDAIVASVRQPAARV